MSVLGYQQIQPGLWHAVSIQRAKKSASAFYRKFSSSGEEPEWQQLVGAPKETSNEFEAKRFSGKFEAVSTQIDIRNLVLK